MGMGCQRYALAVLPRGKARYHFNRRLVGPQVRSGWVWTISSPLGCDPQIVHHTASRYTNYVIPKYK